MATVRHRSLFTFGRFSCAIALAAVALGLATAVPAWSQPAPAPAPAATAPSPAALQAGVIKILRNPQDPSAADVKMLEEFFTKSYYPAMTSAEPEKLGQLAELRKNLFTQFINSRGSQVAHDHLLAITLKTVGQIAIRNYHPAVRYNAVLIIGQLDKEVPKGGSALPVPYPAASNALIALLNKDEFNGVQTPSSVKVAALVGLERHVGLGADPQLAEQITAAALAVANRTEAPSDISPAGHDWMRRLAVRVLTTPPTKALTPPVSEAIAKLIGAKKMNLDERSSIADMLEAPMFQTAQGLDPEPMAQALAKLAKDVVTFEAKEARKYQKDMLGDAGGGFGAGPGFGPPRRSFGPESFEGGFGPEGGGGGRFGAMAGEDLGPRLEKRRLLDRLKAVADAADAVGTANSDELKKRMSDLAKPIRTVFDEAAKDDATELDVAEAVIALSQEIDDLVAEWTPEEEPPAEEEAAEAPAEDAADPAEAAAPSADDAPAEAPGAVEATEPPAAERLAAPAEAAGN